MQPDGTRPGETFFAASDIGWVVGHSYIVYAPLLHGSTSVLFEVSCMYWWHSLAVSSDCNGLSCLGTRRRGGRESLWGRRMRASTGGLWRSTGSPTCSRLPPPYVPSVRTTPAAHCCASTTSPACAHSSWLVSVLIRTPSRTSRACSTFRSVHEPELPHATPLLEGCHSCGAGLAPR